MPEGHNRKSDAQNVDARQKIELQKVGIGKSRFTIVRVSITVSVRVNIRVGLGVHRSLWLREVESVRTSTMRSSTLQHILLYASRPSGPFDYTWVDLAPHLT